MTIPIEIPQIAAQQPAVSYQLEPLTPADIAQWDHLIAQYKSCELFHRSVWLEYLAASRAIEIRRWAIRDGDRTIGYFCGGSFKMGPFRILGSPLKSWGTNFMGPLINHDVEQEGLVRALDSLARAERLAMLEVEHPMLSASVLQAAGFEPVRQWTYIVRLTPGNPDPMWRALDPTCRNRIRKALRSRLTVEDTNDPGVADEYYDFYLNLMRAKGVAPPFSREVPQLLFSHLKKADHLLALRVKDPSGRILAVGLFPHDDHSMYFWSGASLAEGHELCPNDLLHWSAICFAASLGLRSYNMSGYGRFKRKFGGMLTELKRWHKCYWPSAQCARKGYELWFETRRKLEPWRWQRRPAPAPTPTINGLMRLPPLRPPLRWSDIYKAPLHDFPIRDEILYQYLPLSSDLDVLEVGPGSGITAVRLARLVRSVTLLDLAGGNIAQLQITLKDIPNLRFVCGDVCSPGLAEALSDRFDAVYAMGVFDLLRDPAACLKNLAAVLRPGGYLLLQFPNYPPPKSPGMTHFHTRTELERLVAGAGFRSCAIYALGLRAHARWLFSLFHEKPIRVYRKLRSRDNGHKRPLVYDETWAFQHGHWLEPFKYGLHVIWAGLAALMRLGGPCFEHTVPGEGILNRNLLLLARR